MGYPTDLTDEQWALIAKFFEHGKYGNRSKHEKRILVNAILYLVKTGCQWDMLPKDFPPNRTVYSFYRRACLDGTWERITAELVMLSRIKEGRETEPTFCIIDSQSVKTAYASDERGIDGGKKRKAGKGT